MKKLDVMFGLVAAAGLSGVLWTWQQLHVERERSTDLRRQMSALRAQQDQKPATRLEASAPAVEQPAAGQPDETHPPGTTVAYLSSEEARELATRREIAAHMRKMAQHEREMLRDPAYRQSQHDEMKRRYAPLRADAVRAGMTPQQADRVVDLEIERNTRFTELGGISTEPPSQAMQAELRRTADAQEAELRQLLGDDLYAKWNRYKASSQERFEVSQWRADLTAFGEPLNDKQADALAESLYLERQRRSREYEDYVQGAGITDRNVVAPQDRQRWLDLEKDANQRTHEAMAATLSAAQLSKLDAMLAERLVPIETALRMQLEGKLAKQD